VGGGQKKGLDISGALVTISNVTVGDIDLGTQTAASLLRPLALAGAAWLALKLFRIRHPASQHTVWTGVAVGMLLLPVLSSLAPQWKLPVLPAKQEAIANPPAPIPVAFSEPLVPQQFGAAPKPASVRNAPRLQTVLLWIYLAGLLARIAYRATGWAMLRRLVARSKPLHGRIRISADVIAPITAGVLNPVVILPQNWREWNLKTRRAILAHEFAHVRRGDGLASMLARWITCAFWYHPIAWLVARRISETAESACDAAALDGVRDPVGYSRVLLAFAEKVNLAGSRVSFSMPGPWLAMAAPSGIAQRIDRVFELSSGDLRRLHRPGAFVTILGAPLLCLAATTGLGERGLSLPPLPPSPRPVPSPISKPVVQYVAQAQSPQQDQPDRQKPLMSLSEAIASQIPSPPGLYLDQDLEEYHRRQAYGDDHFSFVSPHDVTAHVRRGQNTARGQAYVRFGPPDKVEDRAATIDTPAYQLWSYKHLDNVGDNIKLEFVDSSGTSEYPEAVGPGMPWAYVEPGGTLGLTTVKASIAQGIGLLRLSGTISTAEQGSTVTTFEEPATSGPFSKTISLAPGSYTLTVQVKDEATGIAGSSEYKFKVD
jgi:GWxTD domain-containing protein